MSIHKEGRKIVLILFFLLVLSNYSIFIYSNLSSLFLTFVVLFSLLIFLFVLQFFRNPSIKINQNDNILVSPAEGKIVIINKVIEDEYFKSEKIQVSIFMSPFNIHVNRNPISGVVEYYKYHAGQYLLAWHPKSSKLNE